MNSKFQFFFQEMEKNLNVWEIAFEYRFFSACCYFDAYRLLLNSRNRNRCLVWNNIVTKRNTYYSLRGSDNIVVPRSQSRFLEQSVIYKGTILWSAITIKHPDITHAERWTIDSRLTKIHELRNFHFNVTSASTTDFSNDDFIYF